MTRHDWLLWAMILAAMMAGCTTQADEAYCRGRFSVAATKADSAQVAKSFVCGEILGRAGGD